MQLAIKSFQETLHAGYCGPASLKIVLAYYQTHYSEEALAELTETTKELGTTAEKIQTAAQKLGFKAEIHHESTFTDIQEWLVKGVPVIVDWFTTGRSDYAPEVSVADGHYSVVCGLDDTYIYLQDPEIGGLRKLDRKAFEKVWFDFSGEHIKPDELIIRQLIAIYR